MEILRRGFLASVTGILGARWVRADAIESLVNEVDEAIIRPNLAKFGRPGEIIITRAHPDAYPDRREFVRVWWPLNAPGTILHKRVRDTQDYDFKREIDSTPEKHMRRVLEIGARLADRYSAELVISIAGRRNRPTHGVVWNWQKVWY